MTQPRVVAPRLPTPVTPASGTARLPDDVIADQVRRLRLFALVSGGMWGIGLLMDGVIFPLTIGARATTAAITIEVFAVATAALLYLYVCCSSRAPQTKAGAGLWLMMLNAAGIALVETWATDPTPAPPARARRGDQAGAARSARHQRIRRARSTTPLRA